MNKIPFKLFILLFPAFIVGFWTFARTQFLSNYLSAEQGAMLTPILLLVLSVIFIWPIFRDLDKMEKELVRATKKEALFIERKAMAAKLHDSIAQSLFLMSVKLDGLKGQDTIQHQKIDELQTIVEDVHTEVRIAIRDFSSGEHNVHITETIKDIIANFEQETSIEIEQINKAEWIEWSSQSQSAYLAFVKEGLFNIRKHARPTRVQLIQKVINNYLVVVIRDNAGHDGLHLVPGFGIRLLRERLIEHNWELDFERTEKWTELSMKKEVRHGRV
jgi:signal transduction histidine kinase